MHKNMTSALLIIAASVFRIYFHCVDVIAASGTAPKNIESGAECTLRFFKMSLNHIFQVISTLHDDGHR